MSTITTSHRPAGIHLRLLAMGYDAFLVTTVLIIAVAIPVLLSNQAPPEQIKISQCTTAVILSALVAPFEQISSQQPVFCLISFRSLQRAAALESKIAYQLYMLGVFVLFIGWSWTHGGQTLGMRAWRIRLETAEGGSISWPLCLFRLLLATITLLPFGLGLLWMLFDPTRQTLYDRLTGTRVVRA